MADSDGIAVVRPDQAEAILAECAKIAVIEAEKDAEVGQMRSELGR